MQIEVGKRQKLKVIKKVDFGVYLAPGAEDGEKVLLEDYELAPDYYN